MENRSGLIRCQWAEQSLIEQEYHDRVWGVPVHDDHELFKRLMLECKQAGLSWKTILNKQHTLEAAFDDFEPQKLITYGEEKIQSLLENPGIIRNKLKVRAVVTNAKAYYKIVEQYGSMDHFFWRYVDGEPVMNHWTQMEDIPGKTPLSDQISKDLKKLGFTFVGSTIVYAFMQSVGLVDDHLVNCFKRTETGKEGIQ